MRGRHAEPDAVGGDPQVARERELEAAADRVAGERRERRDRAGVERVERGGERVGDELLGLVGERLVGEVAEVVARREHPGGAGDEHAAGVVGEGAERRGDPSRIAWSSALRLAGLEIVRRRTPSAGRSVRTSPLMGGNLVAARLLEHDERVALVHGLALLAEDLLDHAGVLGLDRHLHLHRLEDHDRVALLDRSPTWHSIFQTVPVMCASTSGTNVLLVGCARTITAAVDGLRGRDRGPAAGYAAAVSDEPADPPERRAAAT